MRTSESTKELIAALVKARSSFKPIVRDQVAQLTASRAYKYATLENILAAVMPSLLLEQVCVLQAVDGAELLTRLAHAPSGEWCESSFPLTPGLAPQARGAELTYFRKYALQGLLSVVAEDDTDGAVQPTAKTKAAPAKPVPATPAAPPTKAAPASELRTAATFITDGQRRRLFAIARARGLEKEDFHVWLIANGIGSTTKIRVAEYNSVVAKLEQASSPTAAPIDADQPF